MLIVMIVTVLKLKARDVWSRVSLARGQDVGRALVASGVGVSPPMAVRQSVWRLWKEMRRMLVVELVCCRVLKLLLRDIRSHIHIRLIGGRDVQRGLMIVPNEVEVGVPPLLTERRSGWRLRKEMLRGIEDDRLETVRLILLRVVIGSEALVGLEREALEGPNVRVI